MNYKITTETYAHLKFLGLEGKNKIKVFDSSSKGFVIGLGMTKDEAIALGIIQVVDKNPLHLLCNKNTYIPQDWITKHLTPEEYEQFTFFMIGQGQSEYGVFSGDVRRFLTSQCI